MSVLSADFTLDNAMAVSAAQAMVAADDGLPDDARLYLRHVRDGVPIRALARETGCHASTILRRIRRFESRRDDPLIDRAIEGAGQHTPDGWSRHDHDQARRILRRLAEPGAEMIVADAMDKAIVARADIRTAILSRDLAEKLALKGWVGLKKTGKVTRHAITASGRAALRDMTMKRGAGIHGYVELTDSAPVNAVAPTEQADHGPAEAARHRIIEERMIDDPTDDTRRVARFNLAESPLLLLARRRDPSGRPFLEPGQIAAGERMREDFEMAQMGARVAQNWDRFLTAGADISGRYDGFGSGPDNARDRVAAALRELGPGMGDLVLRVCCFLEGIEMTERRLGWPSRSAKIVLRLALIRLERHYAERYGAGSRLIG